MKASLSQRCPAELLGEIQRRQISGVLSLAHGGIARQLFIDSGLVIRFAASNHPAESFTALLADKAHLGAAQLRAANEARQKDELLGTTLARLKLVPAADLAALTREHVRRVAHAALAMREGEWEFQHGALPFREQHDAGARIAEVVLEWSRGLTDAAWIRRRLGAEQTVIQRDRRPPEGYQSIRLDAAEGYIMSRVDGAATLREIGMVSPVGDERTLAALLGLALAGILEMPAGHGRPAPVDFGPPAEPARAPAPHAGPGPAGPAHPRGPAPAPRTAATPSLRLVPQPDAAKASGNAAPAAAAAAPRGAAPTTAGTTPALAAASPARPASPGPRPAASGTRRPTDRRAAPVRRPPPAVKKPVADASALPEGAALEAEMDQRFEQIHTQDLYQVLGVGPSAQVDDIRRAYYALARRFHPDRFRNEQVKPRAEKVFGRITEAYATLSDSGTRQRYDQEEAGRAPQRADQRPADTTVLARQNYRTGREHLERGHLAEALGFFVNACQQDPTRVEYLVALGVTQARNPRLRKDAEESLLKAIALDPANADAHAHLGALYDRAGAAERARAMYRKALEWDPDNAIAREGLERAEPGRKGILGLFSRKS